MRVVPILFALTLASVPTLADVQSTKPGWLCGTRDDWAVASITVTSEVTASNVNFNEETSIWTGMDILKVEYVIISRSKDSVAINGQFVGFDQAGTVTFATVASPIMDMVDTGVDTARSETYVNGRVLPGTTEVCATFVAG